jgi:cellulose biosynthesis protein BcsQ
MAGACGDTRTRILDAANHMGNIISIVNHKGGVGKTTSAVNIAAALAEIQGAVLVVDFDPQAARASRWA